MPEPTARTIGSPGTALQLTQLEQRLKQGRPPFRLAVADPHRDTASLITTMLLGESLSATDTDLPALVRTFRDLIKTPDAPAVLAALAEDGPPTAGPASEQAVIAYDAHRPRVPLAAVPLEPAQPNLDYPYAIRADTGDEVRQAATQFRDLVLADPARARLAEAGFRDPDGKAGAGFPAAAATTSASTGAFALDDPARVQAALNLWSAVNEPPRALALFDVSASMKTRSAGGRTRAGVMTEAARQGFDLFSPDARVGMWTFGAGHQEVLPIDSLTAQRRVALDQRIAAAAPTTSDQANLYGAVADAYTAMSTGYDNTRPNLIFVFTDGGDSDPSDQHKKQFTQAIEQAADPTQPIRIVIIGIDASPPAATDLQGVADTVGGGFFALTSPNQVQTIFLKALLDVGEA